eukprot:TRINITY_DN45714_c0_g1_i1.p1 TRINITY_DN45714_c0_g1~~TRINITY_DN45714_c0_g1_i1.p1  ORF type:complete len:100 (+),score=16.65 TRINITY_DN45714_c0_g1_i1:31-300(+)
MSSEKFNMQAQLEHLQAKHVGTGHPETTQYEWMVNVHRDSLASFVGHPNLLSYFAIAQNVSSGRARAEMMNKMMSPCGLPPKKPDHLNN